MKTYRGSRLGGEAHVVVDDGEVVKPLRHHVRHSPDGFEWGYGGSGPSELARCILLDHFDVSQADIDDQWSDPLPVSYQDFKFAVIAVLPQDQPWEITSTQIDAWVTGAMGA